MTDRFRMRAWDKGEHRMHGTGGWDYGTVAWLYHMKDEDYPGVVLMQSTGLEDQNGKEIFEGDVLTIDDGLYEITWGHAGFMRRVKKPQPHSCEIVNDLDPMSCHREGAIIGNIHENPELLEKQ